MPRHAQIWEIEPPKRWLWGSPRLQLDICQDHRAYTEHSREIITGPARQPPQLAFKLPAFVRAPVTRREAAGPVQHRPERSAALREVVLHPRKRHGKRCTAQRLDQAGMLGIKSSEIIRKA